MTPFFRIDGRTKSGHKWPKISLGRLSFAGLPSFEPTERTPSPDSSKFMWLGNAI